ILVVEQGQIVERGTHEQLYATQGRNYDLYTRQQGLEQNLFLAPGEGDAVLAAAGENGREKNGDSDMQPADALRLIRREVRDRKSTRLNSSHRTISYAVFCLK